MFDRHTKRLTFAEPLLADVLLGVARAVLGAASSIGNAMSTPPLRRNRRRSSEGFMAAFVSLKWPDCTGVLGDSMLAVSRAVYHKFYVDPDVFGLGAGLQETAYFEVFFGIAAHMRVGFVAGKSLSRPAFRRALRFFCRAWYVFFFVSVFSGVVCSLPSLVTCICVFVCAGFCRDESRGKISLLVLVFTENGPFGVSRGARWGQ